MTVVDRSVNMAIRAVGGDQAKADFMAVGKAANDTIDQVAAVAKAQASFEAATARANLAAAAFGAAQADAGQNVAVLKTQLKAGEIGVEQYTVAITAQQNALALVQAENRSAAAAVSATARAVVEAKTAAADMIPVLDHATAGHQRMSVSSMVLQHSIRSAGDSFAAGLPPVMIFTEQLGRLSEAAALSGGGTGALGKFGAFMGTGWGIAIGAGISVVGTLISSLLSSGSAADQAKKAHETLTEKLDLEKNSYREVIAAIDDYNRAQEKSRQTTLDAGAEAANTAAKNLREAIDKRGQLEAQLKQAESAQGSVDPTTGDVSAGALAEVGRLKLEISRNDELLKGLRQMAHNAVVDIGTELGKMEADERVGIQKTFEERIKHAGDRLKTEKEIHAEVKRLTLEETAALEAYDAKHKAILNGSAQTAQFGSPIPGAPITSGYGIRVAPMKGASTNHLGVDYGAAFGTPVLAAMDGIVKFANAVAGYGNEIAINHGAGTESRYAHLSRFAVKEGEEVAKGQTIGYVGQTGTATGPHLHFEVLVNGKKVDPTKGAYPVDATKAAEEGEKARRAAEEKAKREADRAIRNQKEFDDQSAGLDKAILDAKKAGTRDAGTLEQIALQEVQVAHDKLADDIDARVRLGEYTKAQGEELKLKNDTLSSLQREDIVEKTKARQADETLKSELAGEETERDRLQAVGALALGSKDRLDVQLRLLDLDKEEERKKLENIVYLASINQATAQEADAAQKRLSRLDEIYGLRAQSVNRQNAGPGQAYVNEISLNAGQLHDALEQTKVDGLRTLNDGLVDAIVHFKSLGDVAHSVLDKIATDLVSLSVQKYITLPLAKRLGLDGGLNLGKLSSESNAAIAQIPAAKLPAEYGDSAISKALAPNGGAGSAASGASLSAAGSTLSAAGTALTTAATQLQSAAASIASSGVAKSGGLGGSLGGALAANDNPGDDLAAKIYDFGSSVDDASGLLTDQLASGIGASSAALSEQVLNLGSFGSGLASVLSSLSSGGGGGGGGLLGSILKLGIGAIGGGITAGTVASLTPDAIGTIAANAAIFADGGYLGGFAGGGGLLVGPGTGTSDSILAQGPHGHTARFSNGEYIVNSAAVKRLGVDTLDRINRGGIFAQALAPLEPFGPAGRALASVDPGARIAGDLAAGMPSDSPAPGLGVIGQLGAGPAAQARRAEVRPFETTAEMLRRTTPPPEERFAPRFEYPRSVGGSQHAGPGSPAPRFHSEQQPPAQVTVIQNFTVSEKADARLTPSSLARDAQRGIATAARKGLAMGPKR